ncbi:MAG: hypothetical protein KAS96_06350 [Planctomycetes bacterium]|nr:hypothetical protein [Planctomycetota bacterium]
MKMTAKIIALASLIVIIAPSVMFLTGAMQLDKVKLVMLTATVIWFISAALWMWKDDSQASG